MNTLNNLHLSSLKYPRGLMHRSPHNVTILDDAQLTSKCIRFAEIRHVLECLSLLEIHSNIQVRGVLNTNYAFTF